MQQKINLPLEQIIDGCNKILNSNQFKVLTKYSNSDNLQDQLEVMKAQSKLMIYSFKELKDWQLI